MHGRPGTWKIGLILSAGLICVSMGSILVRLSQEASSLTIACYRMIFASLFLLPFAGYHVRRQGLRVEALHFWAGGALALHFAFWIASLRFTSVAVSVLLVNTAPVLVALLAHFYLGEWLRPRGVLGLLLSVVGSGVLVVHDLTFQGDWRGPALALSGAAALAVYLLVGRRLRQSQDLVGYVYPTYVISAALLFLLVVVSSRPLTGFSGSTFLFLALLGLIPQTIGHTSYNWALRFLPATTVSTLILAEPALAGLFAWWILGEEIGWLVVAGAFLVGMGILLVTIRGVGQRLDAGRAR